MLSLDDTLRYLPFAALHDGQGFLLERYTLAMTTPQTLDKLASQDPTRVHPDWSVWGLGVTQGHMIEATHESFVPLPMVGAELSAIVGPGGVLAGKVLLDPQFDENSLRDGLEQGYPIIHIASHFKFDPASTDRSFLLLGDGKPLSLTRISTLNFSHVELLTLSACETALGGDGAADHGTEVESLGGIAQRRGAQAVLATLWSVNDSSTALFMHAFYHDHQEQKLGKAAALRQAQLALLHGTVQVAVLPEPVRGARLVAAPPAAGEFKPDPKAPFAHPYYWAPFILMGNWQ
jgi:CHAT domain-containing protein